MTDFDRKKIEDAKKNDQWDAVNPLAVITEEQMAQLSVILESYEPTYTNFQAMSLSVKKTYTRAFLDAKPLLKSKTICLLTSIGILLIIISSATKNRN